MKTKLPALLTTVMLFQMTFLLWGCAPLEETTQQQGTKITPPKQFDQGDTLKALADEQKSLSTSESTIIDEASQLPVRYQKASYMIGGLSGTTSTSKTTTEELTMPVGADISSTTGPISLRDILKRLAALKNMNVSWASDVDQYSLVDVDIRAEEDFFQSIDNILRQLDYFHEVRGNTIVVKYKETRKFHVAMPFTTSTYSTGVGGNVLGGSSGTSMQGNIQLTSDGNAFDIWENIRSNIDEILEIWEESPTTTAPAATATPTDQTEGGGTAVATATQRPSRSSTGRGYYSIDKPIGLITVTAPRPLINKIEAYLNNLKTEIYRQISIEAKIIEVRLSDQTKTGIDWSQLLDSKALEYTADFGNVDWHRPFGDNRGLFLQSTSFALVVSAIETQGETTVLANPKISVMNGQPAMISIGESATYIDSVSTTFDEGQPTTSVTTSTVMSGLGLGVIATIMENDEIILSITPVVSELQGDEIQYEEFGLNTVGLPVVQIKELNTVVRVKDGQVLVVGGLIDKVDDDDEINVPFLSKLPFIGKWIFSHKSKRKARAELVVVLRPKIVS